MPEDGGTVDFIVTGAGSAGCVVAARLSESGRYSVLLLEAGPRDRNPWIHVPMGFAKLFSNPRLNWMFESEPVAALENRTMYQPRGKVLGGTSSINGMIYIRGNPADYDGWRQKGCAGWAWDDVLPYFRKSEDQARGEDALHGVNGPLRVSDQPREWELANRVIAAGVEAGLPQNADFNGPAQEGIGYYQTNTKASRRWSAATAYLRPARHRRNLVVRTGVHVVRLLFEGGRAVGVEYQSKHGRAVARARAEVIVSGGAFGSPQLLQLSGLGPAGHLQDRGIPVVADMPGVGANLQDHFQNQAVFRCTRPITLNDVAHSPLRKILAGVQYATLRSGVLAGHGLYVGAFARSDPRLDHPDLQINMSAGSTLARTRAGLQTHPFPAFTLTVVHLRPDGRGSVRLRSADPFEAPEIRFDYLKTEYDVRAMIAGMRLVRHIAAQFALASYVAGEVWPGEKMVTDADLLADLRQRAHSNLHSVGTCRMGWGADTVVDPRLRVHGVDRLRIVDASIMPDIVAGNTNAPAIMIGEKAADMILQDVQSAA